MRGNDVTLIQRTLEGDQNAFTALVNKYQKWVHTLVWRKIGDFHIAEEITQDVFLKVYKKLSTLKPPEQFPGWLYVITTRHCIAWLRKKRQPTSSLDAMPAPELEELCYAQYEASRGEATAVERQREIVKQLLQKLPESERTVVTLHYLAEMSCEEISEFLGVSPNTVKSRLHRARKRLETQEHLLHDVSGIFQLPPTLTENIMREVARLKPPTPSVSKPWLPWGASLASAILIMLMIGFGARALYRFQQPYNLDAKSEMIIELVEAPIVLPLRLKPDVKTQLGSTNAVGRSSSTGSRTNGQPLVAVPSEAVEVLDTEPQWIQSEKLTGGDVKNLFLTSEKGLYAVGSTGLYRLTDDNSTGWTLVNASLPLTSQSEPMAEWGETLYIATQTNLFASTDRGVTWYTVGPRPRGRAIALLITDPNKVRRPRDVQIEMYLVLADGVFRSTDVGNTWHAFNDGLTAPEIQDAVAVGNVLFLGTSRGLYRLNSSVWEKLPVAQSQSIDSLAVTDNKIYLSVRKGEDQRSASLFTSTNFGESWINITPASHSLESSPLAIGSVKLVAVGETVLALSTDVLRSTDAGNTWEYLGFDRHASTLSTSPAVALDENTIFVAGMLGSIGRSVDGGNTWHPFMTGITELHVLDLAQVNDVLYAVTYKGIAKSTDGGELWTYVGTGLPSPLDKSLDALELSNLTAVGNALYVRAKQGGSTNALFHLLPKTDTLLHIKGMPVYVDSNRSKWLESVAYTSGTLNLDETDQANLFRYQLGIEEAATRTTGEFAISGNTFYIEYERRLYRWTPGHRRWHDTGMQDSPVFADFYATGGFQFAVSGEVIYLGKSNGNLFQSLDGGDTWRDVTSNFPFQLNRAEPQNQLLRKLPHFREIVFSGSTVYVSTSDGVTMSSDGENWRMLTDSTSAPIPMRQLAINGTTLYGVSRTGAYRLNKDIGIWEQIASEIPGRVTSLAVARDTLYIGTEHSGVLRFQRDGR